MANKGYFLQNLKSIKNEELPQYNGLFKYIKSLNYYLKHYFQHKITLIDTLVYKKYQKINYN